VVSAILVFLGGWLKFIGLVIVCLAGLATAYAAAVAVVIGTIYAIGWLSAAFSNTSEPYQHGD
jgi:hypothetical protein